jgi:hypothetical protein
VPHAVSGLVITGVLTIVNVCAFDVPPHGVTTVIEAVPAAAMRAGGTVAVSCVAETNVVANAVPFHLTVEPETKLVPFTVSVNCGPPAVAHVGLSELIVGTALIVNVSVAVPVPLPLVALRVMLYVFAVVGVPEIKPVDVFTVKPAGKGDAPHVLIVWLAVIWYEYGTPVVPQSVVGLVMLGFGAASALLTTASTKRNETIFFTGKS